MTENTISGNQNEQVALSAIADGDSFEAANEASQLELWTKCANGDGSCFNHVTKRTDSLSPAMLVYPVATVDVTYSREDQG
jgi:hypothetical protein